MTARISGLIHGVWGLGTTVFDLSGAWMSSMELRKRRRENVRFKIVNVDGFERAVMNDRALSSWTNV